MKDEGIAIVQANCTHCKETIVAPELSFDEVYLKHLETCDKYNAYMRLIEDMEKKGILGDVLTLLAEDKLIADLKKIMKKHGKTTEELISVLERVGE